MNNEINNRATPGYIERKGPSPEAFRKAKWIRRRRGIIGFFAFLSFIVAILFFDYYWVLISRAFKEPSRESGQSAYHIMKVSGKERREIFDGTRKLLDTGRVDEARQLIRQYLQRESSAEGSYLAGLVYMRQGDVSGAYRNFTEALRTQPDYHEAQQKLAEVHVAIGDLKPARQTAIVLSNSNDAREDGLLLQSEIALAEGKMDEALINLQAIIEEKRENAPERARIQLAILHARQGDHERGRQIIGNVDELKLGATELLVLVRYHLSVANNEKATAVLNAALTRYPNSPEVRYFYGQHLFGQGRYREAIPHFQAVYTNMPHSQIVSYRYGQALIAAGQLQEAKRHIDDTLSRYPVDILALSLKVRYEILNQRDRDAIETLKQTVAIAPKAPRPHTLLAELYWAAGVYSIAEIHAQKALKLGETSISPCIILGDISFRKGHYMKAIAQCGKILEREPANLIALIQTADAYLHLGDVRKAEGFYEKILLFHPNISMIRTKLEMVRNLRNGPQGVLEAAHRYYRQRPDDLWAVHGYVQALILNGRLADAAGVLRRAIKKDKGTVPYQVMLGDVLLAQKNMKGARASFQKAMETAPDDIGVLIHVGRRYESNNLYAEAEATYLRAHAVSPENMPIVNQLAWFYTDSRGELDKARPFIETLRVKGEGAYEKDTVGWFYYHTRDYRSAEAFFREALQLDPENNAIRAHLALALFQMNNGKEAFSEAKKIMGILPPGSLRNQLTFTMEQKRGSTK